MSITALVIPVEGPLEEITLESEQDGLRALQAAVGGYIEGVGIPTFVEGWETATAYCNEEGKLHGLPFNGRATDFMVPGIGIQFGDYIAGPLVLCGFNPNTGENAELPQGVIARARLIEQEAS